MNDKIVLKYYEINKINYVIINEVDYNCNHYVYLSNENDDSDIMVRRVNKDILEPLDSEEEFVEVLKLLIK